MKRMFRFSALLIVSGAAALTYVSLAGAQPAVERQNGMGGSHSQSIVKRGFDIAPVPLDLQGKNRAKVGRGSYLVNAVGLCADCHSCTTYAAGENPYSGGSGAINATNYLAGGVPFGPFTSANISPDPNGRPAGLTATQFVHTIRTGEDPDNPGQVLQVMPWPILRNMTDHDLLDIYEYLSAIPHAEPGTCMGPGE